MYGLDVSRPDGSIQLVTPAHHSNRVRTEPVDTGSGVHEHANRSPERPSTKNAHNHEANQRDGVDGTK